MALADIVRKAVGTANTIVKSFQEEITVARWTGENAFGEPNPPAYLTLQAIVDLTPGKTYKQEGVDLPIKGILYILQPVAAEGTPNRREPFDPRDIFTVPGVPPDARVVSTPGIADPTTGRPYFSRVVLG